MIRERTINEAVLRLDSILNGASSLGAVEQIEARWKRACDNLKYWAQIGRGLLDPAADRLIARANILWSYASDEARSVREQFGIMGLT